MLSLIFLKDGHFWLKIKAPNFDESNQVLFFILYILYVIRKCHSENIFVIMLEIAEDEHVYPICENIAVFCKLI